MPPLSSGLTRLPLVGQSLAARWRELALAGPGELHEKLEPLLRSLTVCFNSSRKYQPAVGPDHFDSDHNRDSLLQGEDASRIVENFIERLTDSTDHNIVRLATNAIRGVALGVVVTAVLQTFLRELVW